MREELSVCEAPIMKIIWESNPDISVPELVKQLNEQYGKERIHLSPQSTIAHIWAEKVSENFLCFLYLKKLMFIPEKC